MIDQPDDRRTLTEIVAGVAAAHPEVVALEQDGRRLTYGELEQAAARLANRLRRLGVGRGSCVAVGAHRSIEAIVAFLGILKAGGAYVPVDPDDPPARLAFVLGDTATRVAVVQPGLADRLSAGCDEVVVLDELLETLAGEPDDPVPAPAPDDLAYVMYTSGSTGRPKGVAIEHRNVVARIRGAQPLMPAVGEGMLQVSGLDFDAQTWEIWSGLLNGARLVIAPPGRPEPSRIAATIAAHDVTVALLSPGLFHQLVERDLTALQGLRLLLVGGDLMSPTHARRFVASPGACPLVNLYGPTEVTVCCTWHEVGDVPPGEAVPIGRPLGGSRLYVLDDAGQPVPDGEAGELYVGGPAVGRGYLNLPAATGERFVPDRFGDEPDRRLYRTGDLVRVRGDGALDFLGRIDEQVKIRGFRIEPGEIEAHLHGAPGVRRAAVVAREDVPGHRRLVAYVVGDGAGLDLRLVRLHLEEQLPAHLVPSAFVVLDELPLTGRGKVDRAALPAPAPEAERSGRGREPSDRVEAELAQLWCDVLGLDAVGVDDDFLELGGDSLLAVRVLVLVRAAFGVELPVGAVLETRTVSGLAGRLREALTDLPGAGLPPIRRVPDDRRVPVSPTQAAAHLAGEQADDAVPYQFQAVVYLDGALDVEALERALTAIVRRHEVLHTRFVVGLGTWWQVVDEPFTVKLPVVDLRRDPDPADAFSRLTASEFRARIAVDELPLVRWTLARLTDERHVLIHVEHHLVHDGWSWGIFLRELAALYRSETGLAPAPPPPAVRFRDFTVWQAELVDSATGRRQLDYWRSRLANLPPLLELPHDRPRPLRQTYRGDQLVVDLPQSLIARLRAVSVDHGATLFMSMLAAFVALLRRASGQDDLIVGSAVSNRRHRETEEDLIGMVLNTVALRFDTAGDPTAAALLEQVRSVTLDALANQDLPFEKVVEAVGPARRPGALPVYQVLFSFQDPPAADLSLPGLTMVPDDSPGNGSAKADLNIVVVHRRGGRRGAAPADVPALTVIWEYSSDLFDEATAAALLDAYLVLLSAIADGPDARLSELPLLTDGERARIIESSRRSADYERDSSIADVLAARVREAPDAAAVEGGGRTLTYHELDRRGRLVAHHLRRLGVRHGDRVAVMLPRSPESIAVLVGVLQAGAAYVALDPSHPRLHLAAVLADARPAVVCTFSQLSGQLSADAPPRLFVDTLLDDAIGPLDAPDPVGPLDVAYVAYTSGSTGTPKGVEVPHRAVVRLARSADYVALGPDEVVLGLAPLAFDASTFEIWGALLNGARLALAPPGHLSPAEIADVVGRHQVTTAWFTAGLFHQMVDGRPDALRGVRQLLAGGDVLSPSHVNRALRLLPRGGVLVNGYGPTEATTFTCCHRLPAGTRVDGAVPIGRPIANAAAYVVDEHGQPVPDGFPGELWIGGDGVALGYLRQPDLTCERFVADPFGPDPAGRLYRSGDLVRRRRDGVLEFLGRLDTQVKVRGVRVELGAIEHELVGHPAVADAVVVAHRVGGDDTRLTAYVVPAGGDVATDELRTYLAERLPVQFLPNPIVAIDRFPLTANGKVDRAALPVATTERTVVASRPPTVLEQRMIEIWQDVLGVRPVGLTDDFFELGGHSLLAVELFVAIERVIGPRLPLATIFEAPTVEQLADRVAREGWEAPWAPLVVLNRTGDRPPLFCAAAGDGNTVGYGSLARRLSGTQPFYALQPRGLDGRRPLRTRVEAMAADDLAAIRSVQRHGPYLLAGRCLGGLVAYELARLLEAEGEDVALVVALDSLGPRWLPRLLPGGVAYDEVMNLARLRARAAGREFGDVFREPATSEFLSWLREPVFERDGTAVNRYLYEAYLVRPDVRAAYPDLAGGDLPRLVDWGWVSGREEMGMSAALLPPPTAAAAALRPPGPGWRDRVDDLGVRALDAADVATRGRLRRLAARRTQRLQAVAVDAAAAYRAGPFGGRITLIRTNEFLGDVEIARWHGVDSGGVDEHLLAVSHRSMLREPDVAVLAACLEERIDAVLEARAPHSSAR